MPERDLIEIVGSGVEGGPTKLADLKSIQSGPTLASPPTTTGPLPPLSSSAISPTLSEIIASCFPGEGSGGNMSFSRLWDTRWDTIDLKMVIPIAEDNVNQDEDYTYEEEGLWDYLGS